MTDFRLATLRIRKLYWVLRHRSRLALLRYGIAPSLEHVELFRHRQFANVIDVGANVGQFALFAVSHLGTTNLVCIEPQPGALTHLQRLLITDECRLDVKELALSDHAGAGRLHVTRATDSSSLLEPEQAATDVEGTLAVTSRIDVPVVSGDEVIVRPQKGPTLLKIDVQGTELPVLRGLLGVLEWVDSVLVEVSYDKLYKGQSEPQDVMDLLNSYGFKLSAISSVPGSGGKWTLAQADLLFDRKQGSN